VLLHSSMDPLRLGRVRPAGPQIAAVLSGSERKSDLDASRPLTPTPDGRRWYRAMSHPVELQRAVQQVALRGRRIPSFLRARAGESPRTPRSPRSTKQKCSATSPRATCPPQHAPDPLTPRTYALEAQRNSIRRLMEEADEQEAGWTPVPSPRFFAAMRSRGRRSVSGSAERSARIGKRTRALLRNVVDLLSKRRRWRTSHLFHVSSAEIERTP